MHSVVISQVFVSSVIFLMIGWSMALLFDLPAVISSSSVPHIMNWAVKFMSFLTTPMLSKLSLSSGRVKVLPWNHRVCDFRLHGSSLRGCIDNPEILLPSQVSAHSSSVSVRSPPPHPPPRHGMSYPFYSSEATYRYSLLRRGSAAMEAGDDGGSGVAGDESDEVSASWLSPAVVLRVTCCTEQVDTAVTSHITFNFELTPFFLPLWQDLLE